MGQMTLATPPARMERRALVRGALVRGVLDRPGPSDRPVVVWCGWGERARGSAPKKVARAGWSVNAPRSDCLTFPYARLLFAGMAGN